MFFAFEIFGENSVCKGKQGRGGEMTWWWWCTMCGVPGSKVRCDDAGGCEMCLRLRIHRCLYGCLYDCTIYDYSENGNFLYAKNEK